MKRNITVNGTKIEITVRTNQTRFGQKYSATNNYGEPKTKVTAYNSIREAVEAEEKELREMLS